MLSPLCARMIANGKIEQSTGQGSLRLKILPLETKIAHISPGFPNMLISVGVFCDVGYECTFTQDLVWVYNPKTGGIILQG